VSPYRAPGWVCGCARAAEPLGACAECGDLVCVDCVRLGKGIYRCGACVHRRPRWLPRLLVAIHVFDALVYGIGLPVLALRPYGEPRLVATTEPPRLSVLPLQVVLPHARGPCSTDAGIARRRCWSEGVLP